MWHEVEADRRAISASDTKRLKKVSASIDARIASLIGESDTWIRDGKKCAYVTVATPSYALGLRVLLRTLRKHSKQPIIVLGSPSWDIESPVEDNVHFLSIPSMFHETLSPSRKEIRNAITKLWVFSLLSLDRLIYVDADCMIKKPIDALFEREGIWCPPDLILDPESEHFSSGLMAFGPSETLLERVYNNAAKAKSYDNGDQGLLNTILGDEVQILPPEYHATRHYLFFHGAELEPNRVSVVHYCVKKPWELWYRETPDTALIDLEDDWTAQLTHEELLSLVAHWRRRQFIAERPRFESLHGRQGWAASVVASRTFRYFAAFAAGIAVIASLASAIALGILASRLP